MTRKFNFCLKLFNNFFNKYQTTRQESASGADGDTTVLSVALSAAGMSLSLDEEELGSAGALPVSWSAA